MPALDLPRPSVPDAVAGASVAMVLIPQSLAYAELASLPPYIGLFAAAFPLLIFSLFASSSFLQTGPTAVMSLLTFAALPAVDPAELPKLAALLALMVGVFRFIFGLARIGVAVRLIALPVITGFTSGAAILIIGSQLPRSLGVSTGDGGVIPEALDALSRPGDWSVSAIVVSILTIIMFLGGRKLHPLFPGVLIAVIVGIVWSRATNYSGSIVGDVPEGLPPFSLDLPWGEIPTLLIGALVIALIGFAEPVSIARTFANETGQTWNANREFIASGLANAMSAFAGGYPVGGSFSRSSVNKLAGARTRWSGGITGLIVLAFLPFAGALEPLPRAVLSAIVLGAASSLVKPKRLAMLWDRSREQALIAWATFAATLLFSPRVERAVLLGVLLTVGLHFLRRFEFERSEEAGTVTVTPTGIMWLGTDKEFDSGLDDAVASGASTVTIDFAKSPFLDDAAIQAMKRASATLTARGAQLTWINPPDGTERMLANVHAQVPG